MRPISDQLLIAMPMLLATVLIVLFALPLHAAAISLVPNIAWLLALVVVPIYPPAMPRGAAFAIGLLQDVLFATPLGSQALLSLILVQLVRTQAKRQQTQLFRVRWLEASGVLIVWHVLLWATFCTVADAALPLQSFAIAGIVNCAWYPVFYFVYTRVLLLMPALGVRH